MPEHVNSIQITGNFDNWSKSIPAKESVSHYVQRVHLDTPQKLVFKFIVNGDDWTTNDVYQLEADDSGIHNNVVDEADIKAEQAPTDPTESTKPTTNNVKVPEDIVTTSPESKVPEEDVSGDPESVPEVVPTDKAGSVAATAAAAAADASASTSTATSTSPDLNPISSSVYSDSNIDSIAADLSDTSEAEELKEEVPDDEILSNIDVSSPEKTSSPGQENLTQVTTGSSYAGVSLTSDYAEVNQEDAHPDTHVDTSYDAPDEEEDLYATPSTSVLNSTVLGKDSRPKLSSQNSESTLAKENPNEVVQILKAPGGYPTSPVKDSPVSSTGRRETLISKFKGLFRY